LNRVNDNVTNVETADAADGDGVVLRGDGLGLFPFGTAQAEIVQELTILLGEPGVDAGPPSQMATPTVNGCANRSELAIMFPGLVVGFSDSGAGMVLDAWAATGFATPDGLAVGDTLNTARQIYGSSLELVDQSGGWVWWMLGNPPVAIVNTDVGQVVLGDWPNTEGLGLFSAGAGCDAESQQAAPPLLNPPTDAPVTVIDLSQPSPQLEPTIIARYPQANGGSEGARYHVMAAGTDRVAVLDTAGNTVRFLDAATGAELAVHAVDRNPDIVRGPVFVGPDDVLYISSGVFSGPPGFAGYALTNDTYREVATAQHGVGDSVITLGAYGITVAGTDDPLMPYVGVDGVPSGATLDITALSWNLDRDTLRVRRGDSSWTVTYVANSCLASSGGSATCLLVQPGPGDSVVLTDHPFNGTPLATRLTVLQTTPSSWDTDWQMVGAVGNSLLLTRTTNEQIEIGIIDPDQR
jgi:hypothetical protein